MNSDLPQAEQSSDFPATFFLNTRRLSMRGLCLADIPALQALNGDAEVSRSLLEPCRTDYFGVARIIFNANGLYVTRPGLGVWHASDPDGGFVGVFSLMPIDGSDEIELGARLRRDAWGRMYSIEGGRALIEHALTTLGLPRLIGLCHPDNVAVPSVLRRLRFVAEGETLHFGNRALRFVLEAQSWRHRRASRHNRTIDNATTRELGQ